MRRVWVVVVGLGAGVFGPGAYADVPLTGTFEEHLSDAKVAGQVLVGLWLGEPEGMVALDPAHPTRLALPKRAGEVRACVTASTRDGEYWMHGDYVAPGGPAEIGDISIQSAFTASLTAYRLADLGVLAELREDCSAGGPGPLVAAISGHDASALVVLVNSQRAVRVQATLRGDGGDVGEVGCEKYRSGRSTAFDTHCRIALPAGLAAGRYTLVIARRTRAGDSETDAFAVSLDTDLH